MCGEKLRSNQEQISFKQQQQTDLDLTVKQHSKNNQSNNDRKRREETADEINPQVHDLPM